MTKIDRYQGWINNHHGAINDHQKNECIIEFKNIPKDKKDKLLNACLNILNEEEEQENQQLQRSGLMAICKEQEKEIKDLRCRINSIYTPVREEKCCDNND